ncbi:hypothetical protein BN137_3644 [Cronobacter condimenti 1330]|uniref:Uncharacterized protein n=1 Tax=Cronobacter condimenti 1330 TaxID=1073999 RepID=K8A369_9ENTR|nr:hypothetical protein [Cronobacter condimenti]CCJ74246.1 hypothetical protein BN137_3644 [Cronobacter condimenti 1330]
MSSLLDLIANILMYWPFSHVSGNEKNTITSLNHKPMFKMPSDDPRKKPRDKDEKEAK